MRKEAACSEGDQVMRACVDGSAVDIYPIGFAENIKNVFAQQKKGSSVHHTGHTIKDTLFASGRYP